jgi:hypothetical protein
MVPSSISDSNRNFNPQTLLVIDIIVDFCEELEGQVFLNLLRS